MNQLKNASIKLYVTLLGAVAMVLASAGVASADAVTDAFDDGQTSITGYIASGIGVIVAVLLLGLGVGLLVKYLRKAVRAA